MNELALHRFSTFQIKLLLNCPQEFQEYLPPAGMEAVRIRQVQAWVRQLKLMWVDQACDCAVGKAEVGVVRVEVVRVVRVDPRR